MKPIRLVFCSAVLTLFIGAKDCSWPKNVSPPPALQNEASGRVDDVSKCEDDAFVPCSNLCKSVYIEEIKADSSFHETDEFKCCAFACACQYSCASYMLDGMSAVSCPSQTYCTAAASWCDRCFDYVTCENAAAVTCPEE